MADCLKAPCRATVLHELVHWTRHPSRLSRAFGRKRWGDEGYAREELVAEFGRAFLCADLAITPEVRADHAAYLASWLEVLRNDSRGDLDPPLRGGTGQIDISGCRCH